MSSSNNQGSLDGQQSASDQTVGTSVQDLDIRVVESQESMKRAAAQQLIGQYFYQLTEGCGSESCTNVNCASSKVFQFKDASRNKLAVEAITLSKSKARLCDRSPSKFSRYPAENEDELASTSSSLTNVGGKPVGEGAKSKIPSPSSSSSVSSLGEGSRQDGNSSSLGPAKEVHFLTEEKINSLIDDCEAEKCWSKLIRLIGAVFSNPESIMLSFRKDLQERLPDVQMFGSAQPLASCSKAEACTVTRVKFSVQESQSDSPALDHFKDLDLTVDLPSVRRSYQRLLSISNHPFQGALINALCSLSQTLIWELKYKDAVSREPNYINIFLIVMEIPMLHSPEYLENAFPSLCKALGALPISGQARLARIWSKFSVERFQDMVQSLQQMITVKIINNEGRWSANLRPSDDIAITSATRVLKILYYANMLGGTMDSPELIKEEKELNEAGSLQDHIHGTFGFEVKDTSPPKEDPLGKELQVEVVNCKKPLIPFEDFVNEPLNDNLDISVDYTNHRIESENKFSFVPYSFILTTSSKHTSMYYDNRIRMLQERRTAFVQTLVHGGPPNPFLRVRVRRDHIVDDALVNLEMIAMENPSDLRKQLFVEFEGEQGLDEGGVSKEFFQLIVEELFNPDIGMFTYNEESHHFWFNSLSFENDAQFILIGILLGLAIYNSCILDIHFPMVVYRKLMGKKGVLSDLQDVDPTLWSSLNEMLMYEGDDVEDTFDQTFRIGYKDVFGNSVTHDLKEDGESITVTKENRQEFVDLYADYLLNKSIDRQFRAFKRGFLMVTSESPLRQMFRPEELEVLVCGSKILDFHALEEATEYDGGFTEDSPTIKNFWTVVHDMTETDKKRLLQFTTGTDRVPIGGLSKLKMIIARNGPDSDRLPTSHTCFNVLLLPEYPTVEKIRDRLTKAITYAKGFGML